MIGQLLAGHYRVLQVLGAGGFGQTYITEDLHLPGNPKCVLKHLKPASNDRSLLELARKLFEKEAIVMQKLGNHDRIPRLLAYFEEQQEFYLVQEYIPGHTLSTELSEGNRWRESAVIELVQELLEILIFIHSQGVIHRDIKPDNIMRREVDRRLILIDFGAIKQVRNQQMLQGQQTMTVAIGTPGYMPIEQASGAPRASSDLYALGKIAIQALTGVNPYNLTEDDLTGELQWEHLTAANPQLIAILQRMTRYHFKDRYLSAEETLTAFRELNGNTFRQVTMPPLTQPREIELQQTVPVSYQPTPTPISPLVRVPQPKGFPILSIIIFSMVAAVGSFMVFSSKIFNPHNYSTDIKSDLCRAATPTDLQVTKVRAEPQRDAKTIKNISRGTKVVYLDEKDAFIKIQLADNSTGWVYNNQIGNCNIAIETPTAAPIPSITPPDPVVPVVTAPYKEKAPPTTSNRPPRNTNQTTNRSPKSKPSTPTKDVSAAEQSSPKPTTPNKEVDPNYPDTVDPVSPQGSSQTTPKPTPPIQATPPPANEPKPTTPNPTTIPTPNPSPTPTPTTPPKDSAPQY